MPLIQKVIQVGDSKAVTIPKSWLEYYERQTGQSVREVSVEITDKIVIAPFYSIIKSDSDAASGR
jgi:antitoxin component of MazEF toxin-antitoxin module